MVSVTITLTFRWPMGHRILGLPGAGAKCKGIHGHNWCADVELPNDDGVLEFGAVKGLIEGFIDEYWDHGFMVARDDPFREYLRDEVLKYFVVDEPPTTECVATQLALAVEERIGVQPTRVHVLEGYRNAATWTP